MLCEAKGVMYSMDHTVRYGVVLYSREIIIKGLK